MARQLCKDCERAVPKRQHASTETTTGYKKLHFLIDGKSPCGHTPTGAQGINRKLCEDCGIQWISIAGLCYGCYQKLPFTTRMKMEP